MVHHVHKQIVNTDNIRPWIRPPLLKEAVSFVAVLLYIVLVRMSQELNVNGHLRCLLKSGNSLLLQVKLIHPGLPGLASKKVTPLIF